MTTKLRTVVVLENVYVKLSFKIKTRFVVFVLLDHDK